MKYSTLLNNLNQEIDSLAQIAREIVDLPHSSPSQLKHYILEYVWTTECHRECLAAAVENTRSIPAISAELLRNLDEERGAYDGEPHFDLLSKGLQESFGLEVDKHVPSSASKQYVEKLLNFTKSDSPSKICGFFLAAEAGALKEVELLYQMTNLYSQMVKGSHQHTGALKRYYDLHLTTGVEQGHIDGVAVFVSQYEKHGLDISQICSAFYADIEAMKIWWNSLKSKKSLGVLEL